MELIVLVGIVYGIWALVSPFVVISLISRLSRLETDLQKLQKAQKRTVTRETAATTSAAYSETFTTPASQVSGDDRESVYARREELVTALPEIERPVELPPVEVATKPVVEFDRDTQQQAVEESVREYALQRDSDTPPVVPPPLPVAAMLEGQTPPPVTVPPIPKVSRPESDEPSTLEEILAGKWLTWVGALAVIIGAGFGFKYAIENNWVGPRERVIIGILTGLACFAGGAYAMRRNYVFLAQGLTGSALGILYLSLYAAFGWYHDLSYEAAFVGMILTTTLGLSFAGYFNVQPTAVLGMLGGFLTPAMLWPSQDPMWTLFPYLLMLDLGVLLIAGVRRWAGLEILAFLGTLIIWFNWHREFYLAEHLLATAGFMTAFLVLFALLSVWHNVIRKRTANAGDFFLIFLTPTAYFTTLYALTFERYPHLQGDFALSLMLFYVVLASLAAVWHPAGRSVIAALAGLASTFLILSVPLELTGHWVTICWIAQAVLLVELGLYFRERTLAWTGLGLLVKVQGILLIYFVGTLADPLHFQTAFVRIQLHLIGRPETPIDSAQGWMSLINGRSLSYLADVIGFSILAWELGRRRKDPALVDALLPHRSAFQLWLNVTVPVVALAMIVLETFAWGAIWNWDAATIVGAWTIWTALFACGLILWSRLLLSRGLEGLGWLMFGLLACFVAFETIEALHVAVSGVEMPMHRLEAWWLLNPRGIGILSVVTAAGLVAVIYAAFPKEDPASDIPQLRYTSRDLMELFGTWAYALALGLVLLETRVWGAVHAWSVSTIVGMCGIWTTAFLMAVVAWWSIKRAGWLENILRGTFVLLQFWFIVNSMVAFQLLDIEGLNATLTTVQWWAFNIRGIGFLVSALGCAVAGWMVSRDAALMNRVEHDAWPLPHWLGVSAYVMGLMTALLETGLWGVHHGWLTSTTLSMCGIWTAIFLVGATSWRTKFNAVWVENVVRVTFALLAFGFIANSFVAIGAANGQGAVQSTLASEWWLLNPHGIGLLVTALACATSGLIISRATNPAESTVQPLARWLGVSGYVMGLGLLILETCLWGMLHDWRVSTIVSAAAMWVTVFLVAATCWRVLRREVWVDQIVMGTFGLLGLLLVANTLGAIPSIQLTAAFPAVAPQDWWLFNPRGLGFLLALLGCAVGAAAYSSEPTQRQRGETYFWSLPQSLGVGAFVTGLAMVLLETCLWGSPHGWLIGTLVGSSAAWLSLFAVGLVAWSVRQRTADFDGLIVAIYLGLLLMLVVLGVGGVSGLKPGFQGNLRPFRAELEWWILNPRCLGFLLSIAAAGISAWLYRDLDRTVRLSRSADGNIPHLLDVSSLFAISIYLMGLVMFSLEVYVQGTSRDWHTATSLGITLVWTAYATLTLIAGIYWRSGWVRVFSLGLFVLTVGKVFLVDVWHLDTVIRVFAFISLGVALLLVSFLYRRFRDRIRSWMTPELQATAG